MRKSTLRSVNANSSTTLCKGGREMFKTYSWRTASLVMALTAIMGLALPALGDDWRPFRGHDWRTFRGHYVHVGDAPGSGRATPLGRFTQKGDVVVDEDGSAKGTEEFTAANGDQLFMNVAGNPTNECGDVTEVIPICGTFKITGGTGQFIDA